MKISTLKDLLIDQLKDLYNAENQIIKAFPKMLKKATNEILKKNIEKDIQEAEQEKERLEKVCETLKVKPTGKKCTTIESLLEEVKEIINNVEDPEVLDASFTATARKAKHYKAASYETISVVIKELGYQEVQQLLIDTPAENQENTLSDEGRLEISHRITHG